MFATLASYLFLIIMYVVNQKGVNAGKGDNGPSAKRMRMSTTAASSHHSDAQVCTYNTFSNFINFYVCYSTIYLHLQHTSHLLVMDQQNHMNMEHLPSLAVQENTHLLFIITPSVINNN